MTVKELIALLQTLPQDEVVIYRCCSEYEPLEAGQVELVTAGSKKLFKHHGKYLTYQDYYFDPDLGRLTGTPEFVSAVVFPG